MYDGLDLESEESSKFVVLKSYWDGGNKSRSSDYKVSTLAVVSGTHDVWLPFEKDWWKVLKKHEAQSLHVTDAVSGVNDFEGWTWNERSKLLEDCSRVIGKHTVRPITDTDSGKYGIFVFTVTVVLADFLDARKIDPSIPQNVDSLLARQGLTAAFLWGHKLADADSYHFFFDQGEPFRGCVLDIKKSKQARIDVALLDKVVQYPQVNSRCYAALQMADMFAWCVSHKNGPILHSWQKRVLKAHRVDEWRDASNMLETDLEEQQLWGSWKVPKRGPTK